MEGEGEGEDEGEGAGKCHAAIISASAASAASTAPDSRKAFSSGVAPPLPPPRSHRVVGKAAAQLRRKAYVSVSANRGHLYKRESDEKSDPSPMLQCQT